MVTFMLGLILAIPLSILANLATPWVLDRWAKRSLHRSTARADDLERELGRVERYAQDPTTFHTYILGVVVQSAGLAAFFAAAATGIAALIIVASGAYLSYSMRLFGAIVALVIFMISMAACNAFVNMSVNALRLIAAVTDFAEYKASVERRLQALRSSTQPGSPRA